MLKRLRRVKWLLVGLVLLGIAFSTPLIGLLRQERRDAALIYAIKHNRTEDALAALTDGADPNALGSEGADPTFGDALRRIFERLVHKGPVQGGLNHDTALSLLFSEIHQNHKMGLRGKENLLILEALLKRGATVNVVGASGSTPLIDAAVYDFTASVHLLLEHGANAAAKDKEDRTALTAAAINGNKETVIDLLDHGADVNGDSDCGTPLLNAVQNNHPDIIRILLAHHADVNKRTHGTGESPLEQARNMAGRTECIELLVQAGAK